MPSACITRWNAYARLRLGLWYSLSSTGFQGMTLTCDSIWDRLSSDASSFACKQAARHQQVMATVQGIQHVAIGGAHGDTYS